MSVFTGKKLKEARVRANLSQEEVAGILKITDRNFFIFTSYRFD
ncbi:hypothetical protein SAMN02910370_02157 [Lachnospiraceae bacterium XPB1003]|nr:hypothetical protein SAMN02910370_02157 [Lachnospiraceae bacterium XPB1003]